MRSDTRPRSYTMILISAYAGAAGAAMIGVLMLVQFLAGHGGPAGNILRVGLAILSFFIGLFLLTVGILYRASFDNAETDDFQ